jgi:hypothetical protein
MNSDWILYNANIESPDVYIDFGWYSLVSACLGKKVWIGDDTSKLSLNTYTVFVGTAGVGKSRVIDRVKDLCLALKKDGAHVDESVALDTEELAIPVGPDDTSTSRLITVMAKMSNIYKYGDKVYPHASLLICLSELASLFNGYDPQQVVEFLTLMFDCKPFRKETQIRAKETIRNGCLTVLAGTTPNFMVRCFDDGLIGEGISARAWFIWADKPRFLNFDSGKLDETQLQARGRILSHMHKLSTLVGPVQLSDDAYAYLKHWYEHDFNAHIHNRSPKLVHYVARKRIHVQKLAALHMLSLEPRLDQKIEIENVQAAFSELKRIELTMDKALATKPRNDLYSVMELVEAYLSSTETATLDEVFKAVADQINSREFVETIRAMSKQGRLKFTLNDTQLLLTVKENKPKPALLAVMQILNNYETKVN